MRLLFLLVAMLLLVPSCGAFGPVALPSADAATPTITTRLPASTLLTDRDMLTLLADDVYHTNISSIAEGQDARSYIGEETTVSQDEEESGGRSWLRTKLQALVGKLLTWRTRPIYDKLQGILDDDLMPLVHQRMAMLVARPTGFEEVALTNGGTSSTTNDSAERTAFGSDDGACTGKVAAWKGGRIDWITTARFFHGQKGFGNMRLDGWSSRDTRAPHLALHLCAIFDTMFIYVSLHPRANLVLDDDYNDYVYGTPKEALGGKSLNDLHIECVEDKAFKPFISKSHFVNAFMMGPTDFCYLVKYNKKNFAKVRDMSIGFTAAWLDMLDETEGVLVKDVEQRRVQEELLKVDVRMRQFVGRDPDTKNVARLLGIDTTKKLVRALCGDADDIVWSSRK